MLRGFRAVPAGSGPELFQGAMKAFGIRQEVAPHLELWTSSSRWSAAAQRLDQMATLPEDTEFVFLYAREKPHPSSSSSSSS
jgi:hypothetical protein